MKVRYVYTVCTSPFCLRANIFKFFPRSFFLPKWINHFIGHTINLPTIVRWRIVIPVIWVTCAKFREIMNKSSLKYNNVKYDKVMQIMNDVISLFIKSISFLYWCSMYLNNSKKYKHKWHKNIVIYCRRIRNLR